MLNIKTEFSQYPPRPGEITIKTRSTPYPWEALLKDVLVFSNHERCYCIRWFAIFGSASAHAVLDAWNRQTASLKGKLLFCDCTYRGCVNVISMCANDTHIRLPHACCVIITPGSNILFAPKKMPRILSLSTQLGLLDPEPRSCNRLSKIASLTPIRFLFNLVAHTRRQVR